MFRGIVSGIAGFAVNKFFSNKKISIPSTILVSFVAQKMMDEKKPRYDVVVGATTGSLLSLLALGGSGKIGVGLGGNNGSLTLPSSAPETSQPGNAPASQSPTEEELPVPLNPLSPEDEQSFEVGSNIENELAAERLAQQLVAAPLREGFEKAKSFGLLLDNPRKFTVEKITQVDDNNHPLFPLSIMTKTILDPNDPGENIIFLVTPQSNKFVKLSITELEIFLAKIAKELSAQGISVKKRLTKEQFNSVNKILPIPIFVTQMTGLGFKNNVLNSFSRNLGPRATVGANGEALGISTTPFEKIDIINKTDSLCCAFDTREEVQNAMVNEMRRFGLVG